MRANIAALPDGTYSYEDFLDNDGVTDEPLTHCARPDDSRRDDDAGFLPLLAGHAQGPVNIARSTAVAALLRRAQASLHRCAGKCRRAWRRSTFIIPDELATRRLPRRSRSAATPRRSCASSTWYSARSRRRRRSAPTAAPMARSMRSRSQGGGPTGRRWVMFCFFGGGHGGNPEGDGLNHGNNADFDRDDPADRKFSKRPIR